LSQLFAAASR